MSEISEFTKKKLDNLPKDIVKGYTLLAELGKGATGAVFLAANNASSEKVAIKFLYPYYSRNKKYISRLSREFEATTKIDHENVVKSLGCGCSLGYYYIILEYVDGCSLESKIEEKKIFDEKDAAKLILEVAKGLNAAHQVRIIHRDIKPANLMMSKKGIIKIADFGLAKDEIDTSMTVVGAIIGTPCYISPEQACGEPHLDIRTDLYSLGITFFHLVVGEPPFSQLSSELILTKKTIEEIPDAKLLNPNLSDEVSDIIKKLSRRDRDERCSSPKDLIADIEKYLAGEYIIHDEHPQVSVNETVVELQRDEIKNPVIQNILVNKKVPCETKILKAGEVLFYENDSAKDTFVLLKGQLEVLKAGRRIAMISTQGTFIGEMSYLLRTPRSATIRALVPTILLEIKEKCFEKFLKQCPEMGYHLAVGLANRLYKTDERLNETQTALQCIRDQYKFIKQELEF